jgi:uncharacterized protein (DUF362 family)
MITMVSKVAVVEFTGNVQEALDRALTFIGFNDLNTEEKPAVIKVGIFNHKKGHHHTTVDVVNAIIHGLDKAPVIYVVESDNYEGKGSERLKIYKDLFSDRVIPFNLSEDSDTREVTIAGEHMRFSHLLFSPHVLVSTHVLRKTEMGSTIKNLMGLIPDRKKARFHKNLEPALLDAYEAVSGIDLAVLDGTYTFPLLTGAETRRIKTNVLIVGRDAVAVEAVGATLVGLDPDEMPIIQQAVERGLGEGSLEKIEVLGSSLQVIAGKIQQLMQSDD